MDGQDVRLRRVGVAEPDPGPLQVGQPVMAVVVAGDDVAAPPEVGVAHRDRVCATIGQLEGVRVGEVRVPGRVEIAAHERADLVGVGVEEAHLERQALLGEPVAERLPDLADLLVIDDGTDSIGLRCHSGLLDMMVTGVDHGLANGGLETN